MSKTKSLNIRVSLADYELIQAAAKEKIITPSALVRSLALTAINNKFEPLSETESPSPNLDKLSFNVRKKLLSWLDEGAKYLLDQNVSIPQVEQAFLTGMAGAVDDTKLLSKPVDMEQERMNAGKNGWFYDLHKPLH